MNWLLNFAVVLTLPQAAAGGLREEPQEGCSCYGGYARTARTRARGRGLPNRRYDGAVVGTGWPLALLVIVMPLPP